jgi:hypothetical protein
VVMADRSLDRSGAGGDVLSSWADKLSGRAGKRARGVLRFAFYGRVDLPRAFRTADLRLIHAAICCSRSVIHNPIIRGNYACIGTSE